MLYLSQFKSNSIVFSLTYRSLQIRAPLRYAVELRYESNCTNLLVTSWKEDIQVRHNIWIRWHLAVELANHSYKLSHQELKTSPLLVVLNTNRHFCNM